jgi:ABC-type glycerol-3-phosphate transport system permease component
LVSSFTLQHFRNLLAGPHFPVYLLKARCGGPDHGFTVVLATMAADAIYRLQFPGRKLIQRVILITYAFQTSCF